MQDFTRQSFIFFIVSFISHLLLILSHSVYFNFILLPFHFIIFYYCAVYFYWSIEIRVSCNESFMWFNIWDGIKFFVIPLVGHKVVSSVEGTVVVMTTQARRGVFTWKLFSLGGSSFESCALNSPKSQFFNGHDKAVFGIKLKENTEKNMEYVYRE